MQYLLILLLWVGGIVAAVLVGGFLEGYGIEILAMACTPYVGWILIQIIRYWRAARYFESEVFQNLKQEIASVVEDHNEIAAYVSEMRDGRLFSIGTSDAGSRSHLASFENTSIHNYKRDRNAPDYAGSNVHNCSLQIVRNASKDPIKYLMKYFGIKPDERTLSMAEEIGESISRLEEALENLDMREQAITKTINPPAFIKKHFSEEFMKQCGVELSAVAVPYSEYAFEYVSAGGNSSQRTNVTLNSETLDALVETLAEKIKFKKSAAGQRALMTAKLREFIKSRDEFACKQCTVSIEAEPNLLLEVDHIVPVSKGGLSTEENLQTLCWRCNRTKSNKMPSLSDEASVDFE